LCVFFHLNEYDMMLLFSRNRIVKVFRK
jgi:hypothetical protein